MQEESFKFPTKTNLVGFTRNYLTFAENRGHADVNVSTMDY